MPAHPSQEKSARQDLKKSYDSLKQYLAALEQENKKLAHEMEEKRRQRLDRLKKGGGETFRKLKQLLQIANAKADRHARALQFLKAFQRKNERLLLDIGKRLRLLDQDLNREELPVEKIKVALSKMLHDLTEMKEHRNRILNRAGMSAPASHA